MSPGKEKKPFRYAMFAAALAALWSVGAQAASPQPRPAERGDEVAVIYDGIGTPDGAALWGRALKNYGLDAGKKGEGRLRRAWRTLELVASRELPYTAVDVSINGKVHRVRTNEEGFFEVALGKRDLVGMAAGGQAHQVHAVVAGVNKVAPLSHGKLSLFERGAKVLITDWDDTLADSHVTNKWKLALKFLFSNRYTTKLFDGAAELHRALADAGIARVGVSSSPWNLYPRIKRTLDANGFPGGMPLRLKDVGIGEGSDSLFGHGDYKFTQIRAIKRLFPGSPLVLVGDAGEKDASIYDRVRRELGNVEFIGIHKIRSTDRARFPHQHMFSHYSELHDALTHAGVLHSGAARMRPAPQRRR